MANMNEEIVYDMDSPYQPSLLPQDIERSLAIYKERDNHCEFASFAYEYSRGDWTPDFRHRMSVFNFNPYVINLKEDNGACVLYHMRSSCQTITNLAPRENNSFDIRIHNEKQNPNVEVDDEISFDRRLNSFTYSNNYPVLGSFSKELQTMMRRQTTREWEEILEMNFNMLIPYLHRYIEGLEDEEDINRAIKDFDYDDLDDLTEFAQYYKRTYARKLSDDLGKESFVDFVNENIYDIINGGKRACFFIIRARTGIVIKPFSMFPDQEEILGTRGLRYRVTSVRDGVVHFSKLNTASSAFEGFIHMPFICGANQVERALFIDRGVIAASDKYRAIVDVIEMEEI